MGFPGVFFMKAVQEQSILKYEASLVTSDYLERLASLGKITDEQRNSNSGVLFKCPAVESGDRVGKSAVIKHVFPCKETFEHAKESQAMIPNDAWHYTLILIPEEFDNRVFSSDDLKINRHFSCPEPANVADLDNMKVSQFHVMWRIAFRGKGFPLSEAGDDSLADIIKKARQMKPF